MAQATARFAVGGRSGHPPLSQLRPFDEGLLRQCVAYISATKQAPLSQLYIVKFNVLIDLFHIMRCGKPVIGGSVAPWELGPVVPEAYKACDRWKCEYDRDGTQPHGLRVSRRGGKKMDVRADGPVDVEEFSQSEIDAMEQAWAEIGHLNFPALKHYTHSPDTFLGSAYTAALHGNRLMGWDEIIASYDRFRGQDHAAIRALIQL
jgi:uncharacterized phage-associated protein